ncbi:MAG: hypothetical protein EXR41_05285 [Candidatus Methylopumilus sp.]|nr:hypothetical protein [Candidatus Methylopumilus sp.]
MNKLLVLTIVSFLLFTMNVFAENNPKDGDANKQANFAKHKAMHIEGIQSRITVLQTALSCVSATTAHEQMHACHEKEKSAMEAIHAKHEAQKAANEASRPK